ncbi:MAG: 50S ribosomal protein L6 [Cyclobacteriaceae bacterium]|nr:50S ribosomal protein L6 [Cyclobacteriaceae bacterium]MCH8516152.1 50S ribosomal protein L6 [Cyclobacteriaceae bacterium]
MSRIGKQPVDIPSGVTIEVNADNVVTVKGPKGQLTQQFVKDINVKVEDAKCILDRPSDSKKHKALHGLSRSLIANMVEGVTNGFKYNLELVGVGYKAVVQGDVLDLSIGYSHNILFQAPEGVTFTADTPKGKAPQVSVEGIDKQLVGQVTAKLRSLRPVEPYKGKGIRFVGEQIRRKAGKTAAK